METINEIVAKVVDIPWQFSIQGDISIYKLLEQSGYFENHAALTAVEIKKALKINPGLVQFWLQYSEDKRTSGGWYFKNNDNGTFTVGNLQSNPEILFLDGIEACAEYIKKEIEEIGK